MHHELHITPLSPPQNVLKFISSVKDLIPESVVTYSEHKGGIGDVDWKLKITNRFGSMKLEYVNDEFRYYRDGWKEEVSGDYYVAAWQVCGTMISFVPLYKRIILFICMLSLIFGNIVIGLFLHPWYVTANVLVFGSISVFILKSFATDLKKNFDETLGKSNNNNLTNTSS